VAEDLGQAGSIPVRLRQRCRPNGKDQARYDISQIDGLCRES
jgi:hypothetical protein